VSGQAADGTSQELTVVFTDLEGFTRYTAANGDEAAVALVEQHVKAVRPVVRSRGGHIVKHLGDGFMLSFPQPDAAVWASIELVELDGTPLRMRAGLHTGDVAVSGNDLVGNVVNIAARVTEEAAAGRVLATQAVCDAARDLPGVDWAKPHAVRLKGIAERVAVCEVSRAKAPSI
jgi:adenylate cyclase